VLGRFYSAARSGRTDVVFGAAFAGRPTDLRGVESIVGPFVNNLPVRVGVTVRFPWRLSPASHARLLAVKSIPVHAANGSPALPAKCLWRHRLFDSLLVFQNYLVDESARRLGGRIEIADFVGPIHTNYPVTLLGRAGVGRCAHSEFTTAERAGTTIADGRRIWRSVREVAGARSYERVR